MKRDIKYRAYNIEVQKMIDWSTIRKYRNFEKLMTLDHVVLMQYTGLKDKNGVEIYEGDIVQIPYITPMGDMIYDTDGETFEVEFKNGMFGYLDSIRFNPLEDYIIKEKGDYISNMGNVVIYGNFIGKVIGNIYENKELLNG